MGKAFGAPEQAKIKQIVAEGMTVMQEIQDLTEGLNETIKAVAEELEVKPSVIKKAIRISMKDQWDKCSENLTISKLLSILVVIHTVATTNERYSIWNLLLDS